MSKEKGATIEMAMTDDAGTALHIKVTQEEIQVLGGPTKLDITMQRSPGDGTDDIVDGACDVVIGFALLASVHSKLDKLQK